MPTGLTLGQLRSEVQNATGQSSLVLTTAELNQLINFGLEEIQYNHDWQGLQAVTDISYLSSSDGVALPTTFIKEYGVWQFDGTNTDNALKMNPIPLLDRRMWLERGIATQVSQQLPRPSLNGVYYYVFNKMLWVVPRPAATITVRVHYLNRLTELVLDSDTNFFTINFPGMLKWASLREVFAFLHDTERAQMAESIFTRYLKGAINTDSAGRWRSGEQQGTGGSPIGAPPGPSPNETS